VTRETLNSCSGFNDFTWQAINKIDWSEKCLIPKLEGHGCISNERQANLNYMSMFTFSWTILLMSMRARDKVRDPNHLKKKN
jgi:hypothetical protein